MLSSNYFLATQREIPADAEVISHQLMLRAGMIRQLSSGMYTWLPTGMRVLKKAENIVREEMNKTGALEILMSMVQPAEIWQESKRWNEYGPELLRFKDRGGRDFVLGPTHEEVITDFMRREISSYKQLPLNLYQIQTKFRDEVRPRFGVMRAREFVMKDAYSFHTTQESLQEAYDAMYNAYCNIIERIGLEYRPVRADTGSIGGTGSHEFQVLAQTGEDDIVLSTESDYAANIELAEAIAVGERAEPTQTMEIFDTPNIKTIADLVESCNVPANKMVKTLIVKASEESGHKLIALVLRGDHELNEIKAEKVAGVQKPLEFATAEDINAVIGAEVGSLGVIGLPIPLIIDRSVANLSDFICGANANDKHYRGVNWGRDAELPTVADIRNVVEGDPSPDGKGTLIIKRGIEVGHVFQLGTKYSSAMNATVQGEDGKPITMIMGCYGFGVSRVVAAAIEQNHDEKGIIWPEAIAPFKVTIVPINMHKSELVNKEAYALYNELTAAGIEVILDDRDERAGVMFTDMELLGIPHMVIVGEKSLATNQYEYQDRKTGNKVSLTKDELLAKLK